MCLLCLPLPEKNEQGIQVKCALMWAASQAFTVLVVGVHQQHSMRPLNTQETPKQPAARSHLTPPASLTMHIPSHTNTTNFPEHTLVVMPHYHCNDAMML